MEAIILALVNTRKAYLDMNVEHMVFMLVIIGHLFSYICDHIMNEI
jgi:hypothetical protein